MNLYNRRDALQGIGASLLGFTFAHTAFGNEWIPEANIESSNRNGSNSDISKWIHRLQTNGTQLGTGSISALQWQEAIDRIYGDTPLTKLKDYLNFEQMTRMILDKIPSDRQEYFHRIVLDSPNGGEIPAGKEPQKALITKVAYVRKGESVPPHGHSNMVSAFLCLSGDFEVQLFDKLHDREEEMVVRRTQHSKSAGAGTWSSISDYRDNVHWLKAKTDDCYFFSCKMIHIEPNIPLKGRIHINLHESQELGKETYIAPKITYQKALELY